MGGRDAADRVWPSEGIARVPFWIYTDPEIYQREQERIFCGPNWSYVALEAEIPSAGDYKRTYIGDKPVVSDHEFVKLAAGRNILVLKTLGFAQFRLSESGPDDLFVDFGEHIAGSWKKPRDHRKALFDRPCR